MKNPRAFLSVTGGARGLGLEMMRALAEAGASVACVDMLLDEGQTSTEAIHKEFGVKVTNWKCDVRIPAEVTEVFGKIAKEHGSIDICVTSAGIAHIAPAEDYKAEDWKNVLDINLHGTFFCSGQVSIHPLQPSAICSTSFSQLFIVLPPSSSRHMLAQGKGGNIILIASICGQIVAQPQPQAAYQASKGAVIMLAKQLAGEWAQHGIRVNSMSPGYIETALTHGFLNSVENGAEIKETWERLTPLKRMGQPSEIKAAVVYLASGASSYVTGSNLVLDGGYTVW
ncbi:LOW QUALITY PROTEIN: putative short-chain dehydrogenase [Jimgerdemannia flammicorona]|uniref:Putative short-chain dehydrogenase n=1 Tax=Jimgerdemannia flammicorona TaxID=994334 RepID=A0A433DJ10_9FUNG|nr:LOW QUALITY PROTEIN: putative short-chain dehydrogenase [Jimgerdemannia flammicorona]